MKVREADKAAARLHMGEYGNKRQKCVAFSGYSLHLGTCEVLAASDGNLGPGDQLVNEVRGNCSNSIGTNPCWYLQQQPGFGMGERSGKTLNKIILLILAGIIYFSFIFLLGF